MPRLPDWHARLVDELRASRWRPFEWGSNDCLHFVARCIHAMTGVDFAEQYPSYDDERGALALLAAHGGVGGILTAHLGRPVPEGLARDGDVVTQDLGDGETAGIQLGIHVWFAGSIARPGLVYVDPYKRNAIACWKV